MSFTDFLSRNPKPTEEELREVLERTHLPLYRLCRHHGGAEGSCRDQSNERQETIMNEQTKKDAATAGQAGLPRARHHQRQERRARPQRAAGGQRRRAGDGRDLPDVQHLRREVLAVEHRQGRRHAAAPLHLRRASRSTSASAASTTWASGIATSTPMRSSSASRAR